MSGFNGLGPLNVGPMTGRGRGYCVRELESGESAYLFGGFGAGRGRGMARGIGVRRGRGLFCWGLPFRRDPNVEKALLKGRQAILKQELNMIERQLADEDKAKED